MKALVFIVVFLVDRFNAYDEYVKELAVKHIWAASVLNVIGNLLYILTFLGIPIFVGSLALVGIVNLMVAYPLLGTFVCIGIVFTLATLCASGKLLSDKDIARERAKLKEEPVKEKIPISEEKRNRDEGD